MKFRSFITILAAFFAFSSIAIAQDDINRAEFFGGFSHLRADTGISSNDSDVEDFFGGRQGANGFNASITGNVSKYVGIKFDFATHSKTISDSIDTDPFSVKYRNTSFMGGVQLKNNMKEGPTVKPFGHVLAGIARQKFTSPDTDFDEEDFADSSFTMAIGGGIDVRVHPRVDIRVISFDYTPVFRGSETVVIDPTPPPTTVTFGRQDNFRIGFGIVIH